VKNAKIRLIESYLSLYETNELFFMVVPLSDEDDMILSEYSKFMQFYYPRNTDLSTSTFDKFLDFAIRRLKVRIERYMRIRLKLEEDSRQNRLETQSMNRESSITINAQNSISGGNGNIKITGETTRTSTEESKI
jgi:hypothetical protein